jgi:hypothetical protein
MWTVGWDAIMAQEKGRDKKHEARNGKAWQEREQVDENGDGKKIERE